MIAKVLCLVFCLYAVSATEERITGGVSTDITQYPYIVSFEYPNNGTFYQKCAGGLISSWHVLTAASCFRNAQLPEFVIRAGTASSLDGGETTRLRGLLKHPEYTYNPLQNDLAIVYVQDPFRLSSAIATMFLPPQDYFIPDGNSGLVGGWGFDKEPSAGGNQLLTLNTVALNKVSQDSCAAVYANITEINISANVLCATRPNSGVCTGDVGAPMMTFISNSPALIGISTFYKDCGSNLYPDVFTRVDRFTSWIMANSVAPSIDF